MKKELKISVNIDKFDFSSSADLDDWNNASELERDKFVCNKVKNYLISNMDEIIYELIKNKKIIF